VIKNGAWVTAMEVNLMGTKVVEDQTVQHIANLATKAVDTAYGGVVGIQPLKFDVPQPLQVKITQ